MYNVNHYNRAKNELMNYYSVEKSLNTFTRVKLQLGVFEK